MQIIIDLANLDIEELQIMQRAYLSMQGVPTTAKTIRTAAYDREQADFKQVADFVKEVEAEAKEEKPADLEGVREAMRQVSSKIGTGAVIEIVKRHGAPSASKLDPSKYAAVIADCDAALANH